jgi:hypothetical protein
VRERERVRTYSFNEESVCGLMKTAFLQMIVNQLKKLNV